MSNDLNAETVAWIEENARLVAGFQERCIESMERQAGLVLNMSLAGGAGGLAYAVHLAELPAPTWQITGMAATSVWLFIVASLVVVKTLWSRPIHGPWNEPGNLQAAHGMDLAQARVYQLENAQSAIVANRARNASVSYWLNVCRGLMSVTPLLFLAGALLAY